MENRRGFFQRVIGSIAAATLAPFIPKPKAVVPPTISVPIGGGMVSFNTLPDAVGYSIMVGRELIEIDPYGRIHRSRRGV